MSEVKAKCFRELSSTKMLSVKGAQRLPEHGREGAVCEVRGSQERKAPAGRRRAQPGGREGRTPSHPSEGWGRLRHSTPAACRGAWHGEGARRGGHGKGAGHGEGAAGPTGESWPRRSPGGPARRARSW